MYHDGDDGNAYKILVGKPDGRIPLRRPRHSNDVNLTETGCEGRCGLESAVPEYGGS
jgi:hypothetical protein